MKQCHIPSKTHSLLGFCLNVNNTVYVFTVIVNPDDAVRDVVAGKGKSPVNCETALVL